MLLPPLSLSLFFSLISPPIDSREFQGNSLVNFAVLNLVKPVLPEGVKMPELIFSRESLQHMNAEFNLKVLHQW